MSPTFFDADTSTRFGRCFALDILAFGISGNDNKIFPDIDNILVMCGC
jgi:hypothetical protein